MRTFANAQSFLAFALLVCHWVKMISASRYQVVINNTNYFRRLFPSFHIVSILFLK